MLLIGVKLLVPKRQTVARRTSVTASIDRWAAHYGVSPRLARALAWQESGFQPHVRSSVGATGVMQVIPATRDFVELFVIGQRVPRTTDGGIRVGVAYLDHLLGEFNGNVRRALGAYYQGLPCGRTGSTPRRDGSSRTCWPSAAGSNAAERLALREQVDQQDDEQNREYFRRRCTCHSSFVARTPCTFPAAMGEKRPSNEHVSCRTKVGSFSSRSSG